MSSVLFYHSSPTGCYWPIRSLSEIERRRRGRFLSICNKLLGPLFTITLWKSGGSAKFWPVTAWWDGNLTAWEEHHSAFFAEMCLLFTLKMSVDGQQLDFISLWSLLPCTCDLVPPGEGGWSSSFWESNVSVYIAQNSSSHNAPLFSTCTPEAAFWEEGCVLLHTGPHTQQPSCHPSPRLLCVSLSSLSLVIFLWAWRDSGLV